jgi:hypothetical protein
MKTVRTRLAVTALAAVVASGSAWPKSEDQEYWDLARKASCPELTKAYTETTLAERKVVAAIKSSRDGTVASNVLGVASLAILGIGFFSWDDNSSAEENLADLRNDLKIITTVSVEKKCELPVIPKDAG